VAIAASPSSSKTAEVWAYCFSLNHVHLILAPRDEAGLARALGDAHRRCTIFVNARGR